MMIAYFMLGETVVRNGPRCTRGELAWRRVLQRDAVELRYEAIGDISLPG